jgi:putative copper resistance protein D
VIWLLRDFDLLSVLLRAASLSLEAFTLGGLLFLLFVAGRAASEDQVRTRARSITRGFALAFAASQAASVALAVAILMGGSGFPFRALISANFFVAGTCAMVASFALYALLRRASRAALYGSLVPGLAVLAAAVAQSHAASRIDNRPLLLVLTALHHLGAAGWVGAMLYLLIALRRSPSLVAAQALARRYSTMAIVSVVAIVSAGIGLSLFYVGSWMGLYGTTYGILIIAKSYLVLVMLMLGAGNFGLLRATARAGGQSSSGSGFLLRLRRFSEAELGLGLTAVLAAASLTSQPPAIDLQKDQLSLQEIVARTHWVAPRLHSPTLAQLVPPTSMARALQDSKYSLGWINDANDRAWSEYNHHWAGLIVLFAGLLAFAANTLPRGRARSLAANWPLLFLGIAVFIILRADPENWPLGPRPFWQSFASPDVLEHRLFAVLISCFAFFEWAVATGRWRSRRAAYVFPLLCAAGGAVLLTHSHGLSNVKDETLADLTHTSIAVMGATAGWCRWLQLRLPGTRTSRIAGYVWPVCLALAGLFLLDYRES